MLQDTHLQQRESNIIWRHTSHLHRIITQGRNRPPPSVGSPTLVWHMGVWRKRNHPKGIEDGQTKSDSEDYERYFKQYESYNKEFFEEISGFLCRLQELGLCTSDRIWRIDLAPIAIEGFSNKVRDHDVRDYEILDNDVQDAEAKVRRFEMFTAQSASFELWWRDKAKDGALNTRIGPEDDDRAHALRVFVQFQSFQDHITITFYIDGAKRFTGKQIHKPGEGDLGEHRERLSYHLEKIRRSCHEQVVTGAIDLPSSPGPENPEVPAEDLKAAADYLFDGIWNEFQSAFGFVAHSQDMEEGFNHGVIFVNQRGLMMSIRGIDTEEDKRRADRIDDLKRLNHLDIIRDQSEDKPWRPSERGAFATLGPVDVFDQKSGEPEVVLKSLWPFLCEMTEHAATKDWVGCGILDWRALFVSTLGSSPPGSEIGQKLPPYLRTLPPERFLIVTKGEPHRKQIGRFVERLVALETMRAIAFKNLGTIQNAYLHLRTLTVELDDILKQWAKDRQRIDDKKRLLDEKRRLDNEKRRLDPDSDKIGRLDPTPAKTKRRWPRRWWPRRKHDVYTPPDASFTKAHDEIDGELSELNAKYETKLIRIAASLERMGTGGSGHIAHAIDEASYYIGEFDRMVPTLEIGNIAGWINYVQFADRGMRPTFNMIKNAGRRLAAAQDRLKSLTDVVQVSALIVQANATRRNTEILREIGRNLNHLNEPLLRIRRFLGRVPYFLLFLLLGSATYFAIPGHLEQIYEIVRQLWEQNFEPVRQLWEQLLLWIKGSLPFT
jgi:hypothetical protein